MLDVTRDYYIVLSFKAYPTDTLDQAMDALMDALMDVKTITDSDISVCIGDGTLQVSMYVNARSNAEAIRTAEDALAEAVHNSGGLADWEQKAEDALREERYSASVRPADLAPA